MKLTIEAIQRTQDIHLQINRLITKHGKEAVLRELKYCIKHEGNVRVSVKEMGYKRG